MNIDRYIESGILESYIFGLTTEPEKLELEDLLLQYPELQIALAERETQVEKFFMQNQIPPPKHIFPNIQDKIRELPAKVVNPGTGKNGGAKTNKEEYIPVIESSTSYIKVHKLWRWVLLGIFILSKIFLILFIYYFFKNSYTSRELEQLRQQVHQQEQIKR